VVTAFPFRIKAQAYKRDVKNPVPIPYSRAAPAAYPGEHASTGNNSHIYSNKAGKLRGRFGRYGPPGPGQQAYLPYRSFIPLS